MQGNSVLANNRHVKPLAIIENGREVDIIYTEGQLTHRQKLGWQVVTYCGKTRVGDSYLMMHQHAKTTAKKCWWPAPVDTDERNSLLVRVYSMILAWEKE